MDFRSVANLGLSRALHVNDTKQTMIDHLVERFNCNAKIDDLSLGVKRSVLSLRHV